MKSSNNENKPTTEDKKVIQRGKSLVENFKRKTPFLELKSTSRISICKNSQKGIVGKKTPEMKCLPKPFSPFKSDSYKSCQ